MIQIKSKVIAKIAEYAKKELPREACGLLVGIRSEVIDTFMPVENNSEDNHQFNFEPYDYLRALRQVEESKKQMLGIIHSHPTSKAFPSQRDISSWFYPELSHWIYSVQYQDLKAFYIKNNEITLIDYQVVD